MTAPRFYLVVCLFGLFGFSPLLGQTPATLQVNITDFQGNPMPNLVYRIDCPLLGQYRTDTTGPMGQAVNNILIQNSPVTYYIRTNYYGYDEDTLITSTAIGTSYVVNYQLPYDISDICSVTSYHNQNYLLGGFAAQQVYLVDTKSITHYWNFGDGTSDSTNGPQGYASHCYLSSGTYNVTINSIVLGVCQTTKTIPITATAFLGLCTANFGFDVQGQDVFFTDSSDIANPCAILLEWDFGDGTTATGDNISHTYTAPGTYAVCLVVTDQGTGCQDTMCKSLTVGFCDANFSYTLTGDTLCGTNTSLGNYVYASWEIANSVTGWDTAISLMNSVCVVLPGPGTYTASLYIIDNPFGGTCQDDITQTITTGPTYCLEGQVTAGGNPVVDGVAYLIVFQPGSGYLYAIDTVSVTALNNGQYQFCGVAPGLYLVKAALNPADPDYANYMPTYHGNVLMWFQASALALNGSSAGNDIALLPGANPGGPGFIAGYVSNGANKTAAEIAGATVFAIDEQNAQALVGYSIPDAAGAFSFPSLAYGSYRLRTDALNYMAPDTLITLGPGNPSATDFEIVMDEATAAPEAAVLVGTPSIYPNPANADARIRLVLNTGADVAIRVIDATGRSIHTATEYLPVGNAEVALPAAQFAPGLYYVTVTAVGHTFTARLVRQ